MRLHNTMSEQEDEFTLQDETVKMYVCGPTPHARAHVGHAKSYISFDILRRYLEWRGMRVRHVMCITDVAEEVVKKSGGDEDTFSRRYEELFFKDMDRLGNLRPTVSPRISENVEAIVDVVESLLDGGWALGKSGRIVLPMEREYSGPLSHAPLQEMVVQGDEDAGTMDILLWDPEASGRRWRSPWGDGRPGWHIQCYTMMKKYLGLPVDLHGGGLDLIFPHHESEILVSRLLDGIDSARFWVHNGLVMGDKGKMSKSLGDALDLGKMLDTYGGAALRLSFLSSHYRENSTFSTEAMDIWRSTAERIRGVLNARNGAVATSLPAEAVMAMDNDLRTDKVVEILLGELDKAEAGDSKSSENVAAISSLLGLDQTDF